MESLESKLSGFVAAAAPPARDTGFGLAVMARIEQRRFRDELIGNAAIASLAALLLYALAPQLTGMMQSVNGNLVAILAITAGALWAMQWSLQRLET
jgi:hypothetical protein